MKYTGSDPFTDENGVLVNKLGIKTQAELELKERDITHLKAMKLEHSPIKGKLDLAHLQAIHKHLFGDIYAWAGQIRDGYLQKDGQDFTLGYRIVPESQKLFEKLKQENYLRGGLDNEKVSNRLAYYLGEINVIHPFRDGNGRTQRIFISQLAKEAGYELNFRNISQAQMIEASKQALKLNYKPLEKIIFERITPITFSSATQG